MGLFGGTGVQPSLKGNPTNRISLQSGAVWTLPAGWQMVRPDGYIVVQQYDPITGIWWKIGGGLTGAFAWVTAEDLFPTTAAAYTNPATQSGLVSTRAANLKATVTAGALTTTATVYDGGIYTAASPTGLVISAASVVTTATAPSFAVGGQTSIAYVTPV